MSAGWVLTNEVKEKYTPIIEDFIDKLETSNIEETTELFEINLSDTELNPYTLIELLTNIGYEQTNQEENGWQIDYWITMKKIGYKSLSVNGTALIFVLKLSEYS